VIVGHVTSGGWGWRLSAMVGLASLHRDAGVNKAWIEGGGFTVQIAGQHYPIKVQLAPFHDPEGRIMRG
jgi:4-methylaminobutanoate oxidase (formaldehyde-forming)